MKKKKIFIYTISLSFLASIIIAYCLYQKSATIYEPVIVKITGITPEETNNIDVIGITPLNRKIDFQYSEENVWDIKYAFLKAIHLFIQDTLLQKVNSIEVNIAQNSFLISAKELNVVGNKIGKNEYSLPSRIHSEDSFIKKALSLFHWKIVKTILKILSFLLIILVLSFFVNKLLKKRNISKLRK